MLRPESKQSAAEVRNPDVGDAIAGRRDDAVTVAIATVAAPPCGVRRQQRRDDDRPTLSDRGRGRCPGGFAGSLARTRLAPGIAASDWAYGADPAYLAELCDYWRLDFDWRKQEANLNTAKSPG
jgi:hypothetical protein